MTPVPSGITLCLFPYGKHALQKIEACAGEVLRSSESHRELTAPARRLEFYAGRVAVAAIFRQLGLTAFVEPRPGVGYLRVVDERGNPMPDLCVNLSHTQKFAVAALASSPVGVDVERIERDVSRVMKRVAGPEELAGKPHIIVDNYDVPRTVALWSGKEAFSKALGLGIKFGLKKLVIHLDEKPPYRAETLLIGPLSVPSPTIHLQVFDEYLIAVCANRKTVSEGLSRFLLDELW